MHACMDRHTGRPRETVAGLHPRGRLNYSYWAFSSGFLRPVTLVCLVLRPYLVYLSNLLLVRAHLSAKMGSIKEAHG